MNRNKMSKANKSDNKVKRNRKPSRGNRRNNASATDDLRNSVPDSAPNDPKWYLSAPILASSTTMVPFNIANGRQIPQQYRVDLRDYGSTSYGNTTSRFRKPGVMSIGVVPTIGKVTQKSDAVNVAALKVFNNIRRTKSGSLPYEASDVMLYILAMDQLYAYHTWMRRIYGYLNTFSAENIYIPRGFAAADNVHFDNLLSHMPEFNYYINSFALKMSAYNVPQEFDLFKRHAFMYNDIYMDAPVVDAQFYMFRPAAFLEYADNLVATGGALVVNNMPSAAMTLDVIKTFGNKLLNGVLYSESCSIISGDILRGYETSAIYKPVQTDMNYSITPIYSSEVLLQIHNADMFKSTDLFYDTMKDYSGSFKTLVFQDMDELILRSKIWAKNITPTTSLLDVYTDTPSPADVMVATRLKAVWDGTEMVNAAGDHLHGLIVGSEILVNPYMYVVGSDGKEFVNYNPYTTCELISTTEDSFSDYARRLSYYSMFANAPITTVFFTNKAKASTTTSDLGSRIIGDLNNTTVVENQVLTSLHDTALMSMFKVEN